MSGPYKAKYTILYLLYFFIFFGLVSSQPFTPRFFTPNEFAHDGSRCIDALPTRFVNCPMFGVMIDKNVNGEFTPMTQEEIEEKCASLNFRRCDSNTQLFPDGICRNCPENFPFIAGSGTGSLWCEDNNGSKLFFENPFNCNTDGSIKRLKENSYRPCAYKSETQMVPITNYSPRLDSNFEYTFQRCYENIIGQTVSDLYTIIVRTEFTDVDHGFLQCPRQDIPYSFLGNVWLSFYGIFAIGIVTIAAYTFIKLHLEKVYHRTKSEIQESYTREGSLLDNLEIEISESYKMKQFGYKNNIFGNISWFLFWLMSWALHVFMFILDMDIYGMWLNTLCPASVNEYCNEVGGDYSWRSGFVCSTGCIFSFKLTTGFDNYWPYADNPGGIQLIYGIICTAFFILSIWWILILVFYKRLDLFFSIKCTLNEADYIVCTKPKDKDIRVEGDNNNYFLKLFVHFEFFLHKHFGTNFITEKCKVHVDNSGQRYIFFQCIKYSYYKSEDEYRVKNIQVVKTKEDFHKGKDGLTSQESYNRLKLVGENKINYEVPNWGTSIWNEFFSFFYIYQFVFMWIWLAFYYWLLTVIINFVAIVSGIISTLIKRSSQKTLRSMSNRHGMVKVKRDNQWESVSSHLLVPGDIIAIEAGNQVFCDCVLVKGRSVLNESSLTGEPTPVPKMSIPNNSDFFGMSTEDMKYTLLSGTKIESASSSNNDYTCALVISTGVHTKQGQLMRSMLFPPRLRFKFDDHFAILYSIIFAYGIVILLLIAYLMNWIAMSLFYGIFTIAHCLSPLVPAMFTAAQAHCTFKLKKKNIFCTEINRTFVAAKVKIFCFDKTGTLTKQGMEFHGYSAKSEQNEIIFKAGTNQISSQLEMTLGCCHELDFFHKEGELKTLGNEVDVAMFESSNFTFGGHRNGSVTIEHKTNSNSYQIVKIFEFNRETMMMSVILQDLNNDKFYVLTKGSYERVLDVSKKDNLPTNVTEMATHYAMLGHYILGVSLKEILDPKISRIEAESNLDFIGLLHFKNELKGDTNDVIQHLKAGNIECLMITGDNLYTACAIAQESGLSTSSTLILGDVPEGFDFVVWRDLSTLNEISIIPYIESSNNSTFDLALSNKAFDLLRKMPLKQFIELSGGTSNFPEYENSYAMNFLLQFTKIFARMKPDHKVEAVRLNMERAVTGMCGDGANDAAALRLAHCGIAISIESSNGTIVAPFCSPDHSLNVVVDIIRYGRGTLASAFAGYKRLIMEGQTIVILKYCLYHASLQLSEISWIFADGIINVGMMLMMLNARPAKKLNNKRPTSSLLGPEILLSCIFQVIIVFATYALSLAMLFASEFFSCKNFDTSNVNLAQWWTMGDNYESSVLSIATIYLLINHGFIFNYGYHFRKHWYKNYTLNVYFIIIFIIITCVLFNPPNFLTCFFRINCGDHYLLEQWNKLGKINYDGTVPFVPEGCPCSEQIGYDHSPDYSCENEYIDCPNDQYNSVFHHILFPLNFKIQFFLLMMGSFLASVFAEWFVIFGPVRKYFSSKRNKATSSMLTKVV